MQIEIQQAWSDGRVVRVVLAMPMGHVLFAQMNYAEFMRLLETGEDSSLYNRDNPRISYCAEASFARWAEGAVLNGPLPGSTSTKKPKEKTNANPQSS